MTSLLEMHKGCTCELCSTFLQMKIGAGVLQGVCQNSTSEHYGHVLAFYHPACKYLQLKKEDSKK